MEDVHGVGICFMGRGLLGVDVSRVHSMIGGGEDGNGFLCPRQETNVMSVFNSDYAPVGDESALSTGSQMLSISQCLVKEIGVFIDFHPS